MYNEENKISPKHPFPRMVSVNLLRCGLLDILTQSHIHTIHT